MCDSEPIIIETGLYGPGFSAFLDSNVLFTSRFDYMDLGSLLSWTRTFSLPPGLIIWTWVLCFLGLEHSLYLPV